MLHIKHLSESCFNWHIFGLIFKKEDLQLILKYHHYFVQFQTKGALCFPNFPNRSRKQVSRPMWIRKTKRDQDILF